MPDVKLPEPRLTRATLGSEPLFDWDGYYKANDESNVDFMIRLTVLREKKYFGNIERALKAYMRYHGKNVNANMYELLAVAIKKNGGPEAEVKDAISWAAYLAKRSNQPLLMTSVADLMNINRYPEVTVKVGGRPETITIGELLDRAAELAPQREEPLVMSMNLAVGRHDSARMISTAERILALGWPGKDEAARSEVRRIVEAEAKRLDQEGQHDASQDLRNRLADAEQRDIYLRLTWEGDAWVGLDVEEPLGARANLDSPRTVFGGAVVKEGRGKDAESIYTCPLAFSGDYKVRVRVINYNEKEPVRQATLEIITHEGTPAERKETRTIDLAQPTPVVFHLDDGRRKRVLPFQAPAMIRVTKHKVKGKDKGQGAAKTAESKAARPAPKAK